MACCQSLEWLRNIPTKVVEGNNPNCPDCCCDRCSCDTPAYIENVETEDIYDFTACSLPSFLTSPGAIISFG